MTQELIGYTKRLIWYGIKSSLLLMGMVFVTSPVTSSVM